jgi:hypothetical protein
MMLRRFPFICKHFPASLCNNVKKKLCRRVSSACLCRKCVELKTGQILCRIVSDGTANDLPPPGCAAPCPCVVCEPGGSLWRASAPARYRAYWRSWRQSRKWNCSTGASRRRATALDTPLRRTKTSIVNPKPFCQTTCPTWKRRFRKSTAASAAPG